MNDHAVMHDARPSPATEPPRPDGQEVLRVLFVPVVAIFLLLQFTRLAEVPFRSDEAIAAIFAAKIATAREFPLLGLRTSFGFHNPPTLFYLLAPTMLFGFHTVVAFGVVVLAHLAGALCLVRRLFRTDGPVVSLAALALALLSANALEHSRRLWGHDLLFPFGVAAWLLAWPIGALPSRRRLFLAALAAAIAQSLHLSGVVFWLPVIAAWWRLESPRRLPAAALLLLALFIPYAPWLAGNALGDGEDFRVLRGLLASIRGAEAVHIVPPESAWAFVLGDSVHEDALQLRPVADLGTLGAVGTLLADVGALSLLALVLLKVPGLRARDRHHENTMLLLWICAPLLLFAVLFRASVPAYMLPALPPAVVLAARLIRGMKRGRALLSLLILSTVSGGVLQAIATTSHLRQHPEHGVPTYAGQRDALLLAVEEGRRAGVPFAIHQNARARHTGPDVAIGWLWLTLDPSGVFPSPPEDANAINLFILVDPQARLPLQCRRILRGGETWRVGGFEVIRLQPPFAEAYLRAADRAMRGS